MKYLVLLLITLVMATTSTAQAGVATESRQGVVVDYMVATVNNQLITYSDVIWQLALQPGEAIEQPRAEILERALRLLIDQRLIFQEAEKLPHIHSEDNEIQTALTELVRHFSSEAELRRRMARVGLTSERLREIIHERVDIEKYLDFRFRSFVVITAKEIETYYRDIFVPRFRSRFPGAIVPQLERARAEIERILTEGRIESAMGSFLDELRQRSEIVMMREFK